MTIPELKIKTLHDAIDAFDSELAGAHSTKNKKHRRWAVEILRQLDDVALSALDGQRCFQMLETVRTKLTGKRGRCLSSSTRTIVEHELIRLVRWMHTSALTGWTMPEGVEQHGSRTLTRRLSHRQVLRIGGWLRDNQERCKSMTAAQAASSIRSALGIEAHPQSVADLCDELSIDLISPRPLLSSDSVEESITVLADAVIHLYEQLGERPPASLLLLDTSRPRKGCVA